MPELRRIRLPRTLSFTLEGKWFVIITIIVGFGAMNTGNNLLYLVLGMLLCMIIASGILSERVLKKVTIKRLPSGDIFANKPARISIEVKNNKKKHASYSITIGEEETKETLKWRRKGLGLPEEIPKKKKKREKENDPGAPKILFLKVDSSKTKIGTTTHTFPRRGLYQYTGLNFSTRFPFGFFEKTKYIELPNEILVFPEIRTRLRSIVDENPLFGEVARGAQGRTGNFWGLREYREGEDLRDVHWKVSARRGKLVRKLYEREDNESIALYLYNWIPKDSPETHLSVEEAIIEVASACALLTRRGIRYSLTTINERVSEGIGPGQLKNTLRHLALLQIKMEKDPPKLAINTNINRLLFATTDVPAIIRSHFDAKQILTLEEKIES